MKRKLQTARELFIMFLVKLGFSNTSVPVKIIKARRIISMMTGNASFGTPSPSLATLTTQTDALEDAEAAMDGSKLNTDLRNAALQTLSASLKLEQLYVEAIANGNTAVILSSGFEVRNPRTNPVLLPAPENLLAKPNGFEKQLKLTWKAVKKKDVYTIEMTADPTLNNWQIVAQSTKAKVVIEDLNSGQMYYFRVTAVNAAGASPWSDTAGGRPS